jgi:FkbH-like protein
MPEHETRFRTLPQLLRSRAGESPNRTACIVLSDAGDERTISYRELDMRAQVVGAWISSQNFTGKPVLILNPEPAEFIECFLGCLYAGALAVPMPASGQSAWHRLEAAASDCQPVAILASSKVRDHVLHKAASDSVFRHVDWKCSRDIDLPEPNPEMPAKIVGESPALLQYTSGTTSKPKGVIITHRCILANELQIQRAMHQNEDSIVVSWLPLHHDMGLIGGLLQPLTIGATCILFSPLSFLRRPSRWFEIISRYRATTSGGPNFGYELCVRNIDIAQLNNIDLSTWSTAFVGSDQVRAETLSRFGETFASFGFSSKAFYPCYGLAESTLMVTGPEWGREPRVMHVDPEGLRTKQIAEPVSPEKMEVNCCLSRALVGCGTTFSGTEIRIVRPETDAPCADLEIGEICVRGDSVTPGYWTGSADLTSSPWISLDGKDGQRFFRTGDLGFFADGELFITGRLNEKMIFRGMKFYPEDIEATVRRELGDALKIACACFSVVRPGEDQLAVVCESGVRGERLHSMADRLRTAILGEHGIPLSILVFVRPNSLPRTTSGKIVRGICRQSLEDEELAETGRFNFVNEAIDSLEDDLSHIERSRSGVTDALRKRAAELLGIPAESIDDTSPLLDLGFDSLLAARFITWIESRFDITLESSRVFSSASIQTLTEQIIDHPGINQPRPDSGSNSSGESLLSFDQERLWILQQAHPEARLTLQAVLHLKGNCDEVAVKAAVEDVAGRHLILSASFTMSEGRPVQRFPSTPTLRCEVQQVGSNRERAAELFKTDRERPFDLEAGEVARVLVVRMEGSRWAIALTLHHLAGDATSILNFYQEFGAAYTARRRGSAPILPLLEVGYGDFVLWQRAESPRWESAVSYWRTFLAHPSTQLRLGGGTQVNDLGWALQHHSATLPGDLIGRIRDAGGRLHATPFAVLLAGFECLIEGFTSAHNFRVAVPVHGRFAANLDPLIGMFAYPVIVAAELTPEDRLSKIIGRVQSALDDANSHREIPFAKMLEAAETPAHRTSLPSVMFTLIPANLDELHVADDSIVKIDFYNHTDAYDMTVTLCQTEDETLVDVAYNASVLDASTVRRLCNSYADILARLAAEPDALLREVVSDKVEHRNHDNSAPRPSVVIVPSFTAEPLREIVEFWMRETHLELDIVLTKPEQFVHELAAPDSILGQTRSGFGVIMIRPGSWIGSLDDNAAFFANSLEGFVARSAIPLAVFVCPDADGSDALFRPLLASRLAALHITVVWPDEISKFYPVASQFDSFAERTADIPYTSQYFTAMGTSVARTIYGMARGGQRKIIVVDCDDTLWKGRCGEDGPARVVIDERAASVQRFLVDQVNAGMLLCVCSKNNPEDVEAAWDAHPEMPLQRSDILAWRVNWAPKNENLRSLAQDLDLSTGAFVFLDDDLKECAEMASILPGVLVLNLARENSADLNMSHVWPLDHRRITDEDRGRTALYRSHQLRESERKNSLSLSEFIKGLQLDVHISPAASEYADRMAELTERTTQMNLNGIRRAESELRQLFSLPHHRCLAVHARDRFGDYGLSGLTLCEMQPGTGMLTVQTFLLSCRSLGRGIEHRMLVEIAHVALAEGLPTVTLQFVETPRNSPARALLAEVAEQLGVQWHGGDLVLAADRLANLEFAPASGPANSASSHSRADISSGREADLPLAWNRIARDLTTVNAIDAAIATVQPKRSRGNIHYAPPRTPTEEIVASLVADLLGLDRIGVDDNFFDLGGQSLVAARLVGRIHDEFGVQIPLRMFFTEVITVGRLAEAVDIAQIEQADPAEVDALLREMLGSSEHEDTPSQQSR